LSLRVEDPYGSASRASYDANDPTRDQVEAEIAAHGFSIVELEIDDSGRWHFNRNSPFNRRSTGSTPMEITGPLRGNALVRTAADPTGAEVRGSLNNCAGGKTPWGTVLTCEENFDQYFANFPQSGQAYELSKRIAASTGESYRKWERFDDRFDLSRNPQEYHRFGYVVEVDPYDPSDKPKKRTALGRCKHEGAAAAIAPDGRVAIYSGDDARFESWSTMTTAICGSPRTASSSAGATSASARTTVSSPFRSKAMIAGCCGNS